MSNFRHLLLKWPNHQQHSADSRHRVVHTEPDEVSYYEKSRSRGRSTKNNPPIQLQHLADRPPPPISTQISNLPVFNKPAAEDTRQGDKSAPKNSKGSIKSFEQTKFRTPELSRMTFEFDNLGLEGQNNNINRIAEDKKLNRKVNVLKRPAALPNLHCNEKLPPAQDLLNPNLINLNNLGLRKEEPFQDIKPQLPQRKTRIINFMIDMLSQQNSRDEESRQKRQLKWVQTPSSLEKQRGLGRLRTQPTSNDQPQIILGESLLDDSSNRLNLNYSLRNHNFRHQPLIPPARKNKGPRILQNEILKHSTNLNVIRKKMLSEHRSREESKCSISKEAAGLRMDIKSSENARLLGNHTNSRSVKDGNYQNSVNNYDEESKLSFHQDYLQEDGVHTKDNGIVINTGLETVTFYPKSSNKGQNNWIQVREQNKASQVRSNNHIEQSNIEDNEFISIENVQITNFGPLKR